MTAPLKPPESPHEPAGQSLAVADGSACPKCGRHGEYIRDRGFADGSGHVWVCNNPKCLDYHLYYYGKSPNDPSSATRPAGRLDCNRDAMAGFAAAHG